jgi:hypothetical protein
MMPLFLLRMDSTAHHFLFCITLSIALHHYLRRCFTSWEGLDIACFSDAQLRSFTPRSLDPHGRAVGSMLLAFVRTSRGLARGQPQVADISRSPRMTTGVKKDDHSQLVR